MKTEVHHYMELDVDAWNVLVFGKFFFFQQWDPSNF
jgi:hypothetical protein